MTLPPRRSAAAALALLLAGCAAGTPDYPVTREAEPFPAYDARVVGRAPPVVRGVTAERLAAARAGRPAARSALSAS
jgi:hypothetical protein